MKRKVHCYAYNKLNLDTLKRDIIQENKNKSKVASYQIRCSRLNTTCGFNNLSDFGIFTFREPHRWRIRIRFLLTKGT